MASSEAGLGSAGKGGKAARAKAAEGRAMLKTAADTQDIGAERAARMRDFVFEALAPVEAVVVANFAIARRSSVFSRQYGFRRCHVTGREGQVEAGGRPLPPVFDPGQAMNRLRIKAATGLRRGRRPSTGVGGG
jgi:hypothetical protein